jgi:pimeloyl-ACP methyl ester carboxylesterase
VSAAAPAFADAIEGQGVEAAGARFVWGPESGLDEGAAAWVRQGFLEHRPQGLAHTLRSFLASLPVPEQRSSALAQIRVPTLVVAGEEDFASLATCRALTERVPGARLEVVEGAGHVVNLSAPAAFNRVVGTFLSEL